MKFRYKHQLVLQLPGSSLKDYDGLIELENFIAAGLGTLGEVDGHDMGCGEMNIFIYTDYPKLAFDQIKSAIGTNDFMPELKAAFRGALRDIGKDDFTILFPAGLSQFTIK